MGPAATDVSDAEALGRSLLPPNTPLLRELIRKRPWRVFADVALNYALIALAFALLARWPSMWSAALAFVVIGNRQYALSVLTHEGDHRTLFARRSANDLFARVALCAPVGVDFDGERRNHALHHRHMATGSDPDRYLYSVNDKSTRADFALFLTGLTAFPRALKKALHGRPSTAPWREALRGFVTRRGGTLVAQAVIFAAISARFPPWYYVVFWLAPVYPMVFVPHKIRMFCEHALAVSPDEDADARRLITYTPGLVERLLVTPYNLHLHAEHHLWPFVPYYNLGRLRALLADRPEVTVRASYAGFIVAYFRQLPLPR